MTVAAAAVAEAAAGDASVPEYAMKAAGGAFVAGVEAEDGVEAAAVVSERPAADGHAKPNQPVRWS